MWKEKNYSYVYDSSIAYRLVEQFKAEHNWPAKEDSKGNMEDIVPSGFRSLYLLADMFYEKNSFSGDIIICLY